MVGTTGEAGGALVVATWDSLDGDVAGGAGAGALLVEAVGAGAGGDDAGVLLWVFGGATHLVQIVTMLVETTVET